jgi:hypothetical protein
MDFKRLEEILKTELPMNRKERFFSATVLPSLLLNFLAKYPISLKKY